MNREKWKFRTFVKNFKCFLKGISKKYWDWATDDWEGMGLTMLVTILVDLIICTISVPLIIHGYDLYTAGIHHQVQWIVGICAGDINMVKQTDCLLCPYAESVPFNIIEEILYCTATVSNRKGITKKKIGKILYKEKMPPPDFCLVNKEEE